MGCPVHDRSLAERAALAGLAVPGGPSVYSLQLRAYLRRVAEEAREPFTADDETREKIARYLSAVGMQPTDPWAYVEVGFIVEHGERRAAGGVVIPMAGPRVPTSFRGMGRLPFSAPFAWTDQQRPYRLEVFGGVVATREDWDACPRDNHWILQLTQGGGEDDRPVALDIGTWRARAIHPEAGVVAQTEWRPGWTEIEQLPGGKPQDPADPAAIGMSLLRDINLRRGPGAPRKPRSKKLTRLAKAGLKWLHEHPGHEVEDVGRPQLAEATGRERKTLDEHMRKNEIVNDDVHDHMRELLGEELAPKTRRPLE